MVTEERIKGEKLMGLLENKKLVMGLEEYLLCGDSEKAQAQLLAIGVHQHFLSPLISSCFHDTPRAREIGRAHV